MVRRDPDTARADRDSLRRRRNRDRREARAARAASTRHTVLSVQFETQREPSPAAIQAGTPGSGAVWIVAVTAFVAGSIAAALAGSPRVPIGRRPPPQAELERPAGRRYAPSPRRRLRLRDLRERPLLALEAVGLVDARVLRRALRARREADPLASDLRAGARRPGRCRTSLGAGRDDERGGDRDDEERFHVVHDGPERKNRAKTPPNAALQSQRGDACGAIGKAGAAAARTARDRRPGRNGAARGREAGGGARAARPPRRRGRVAGAARRRALGRRPSRHGGRGAPDARRQGSQAARRGRGGARAADHARKRLRAPARDRRARRAAVPCPRRRGAACLARTRPGRAAPLLSEALGLWRGDLLDGLAPLPFVAAERSRFGELRLEALEHWYEAELDLGHHAEVAAELEHAVAEEPLRDRLRELAMLALYRCGRQADALELYQSGRRALSDELGLEPSPRLRKLEQAILRHDSSLELAAAARRRTAAGARPVTPAGRDRGSPGCARRCRRPRGRPSAPRGRQRLRRAQLGRRARHRRPARLGRARWRPALGARGRRTGSVGAERAATGP